MTAAGAATNALLDALNPQQREAVEHTDGPLLVVAGAGSGKTRVLTHRVAHLIEAGVAAPGEILAITFTNRAANEMKERVERLVGGRTASRMWVMTFHAACGRLLRRDAQRIGYRPSFTIYDQADQVRLVKACIEELELDPKRFAPRAVHSAISRAKDRLLTAEAYGDQVGNFFEQTVASVYALYQRRLYAANAMDFDDMILQTVLLLEADADARATWQERFSHIMVDEYQDTNHAQFRLLAMLAEQHQNLAVVGDPDQSIYAFRGADIRNIAEFEHDFPGARVVALEQNYRSTQAILDAANSVIARNPDRRPKRLWSDLGTGLPVRVVEADDEHGEARYVAGEIAKALDEGAGAADIAVFYRMNAQSRVLEDVLVRQGVGYRVVGGPRFYERAEIKDAIAYLQVVLNPADEVSLRRIVNQPRRGIGSASLDRLAAHAADMNWTLSEAIENSGAVALGTAAAGRVREFAALMADLREAAAVAGPAEMLELVLAQTGYRAMLEAERTFESQGRVENLDELVGVAREFEQRGEEDTVARHVPAGDLALLRLGRAVRAAARGDADDAAQREGARVSDRVRDRPRGGPLPAPALARRGRRVRGAAALLRRDDPRPPVADDDARPQPHHLRRARLQHALALPERASGRRHRARAPGARLAGAARRRRAAGPRSSRCPTSRWATRCATQPWARASSSGSTATWSRCGSARTAPSGG